MWSRAHRKRPESARSNATVRACAPTGAGSRPPAGARAARPAGGTPPPASRCEPGRSPPTRRMRSRSSRSAGAMTRSPDQLAGHIHESGPSTCAAIWSGVAAAPTRSPHSRSCPRPDTSSPGVRGNRMVGTSEIDSTPPGRSTRNASSKKTCRERKWNAASTLMTPSADAAASGRRVASPTNGQRCAPRQPLAPCPQLRLGDVDRHEPGRLRHVGDDRVLRAEAVPHVHDGAPGGQHARQPLDQPPDGAGRLLLGARPLPQAEVEPPRSRRQRELRPDALVHARGGIAPVSEDEPHGMTDVLAGPIRPGHRAHGTLAGPEGDAASDPQLPAHPSRGRSHAHPSSRTRAALFLVSLVVGLGVITAAPGVRAGRPGSPQVVIKGRVIVAPGRDGFERRHHRRPRAGRRNRDRLGGRRPRPGHDLGNGRGKRVSR